MMTFSDKEVKKIYLGKKKIWEEGAGGVTPAMVEEAVKRGDTETLHILYQADPKKAIKGSNTALEMLAEAYPNFYEFVEFPGGKLNRLDLPSEDIYLGTVENEAFGTFVGGSEDGKAFNGDSLNAQTSLTKGKAINPGVTWHRIYDGSKKKIYYIPNNFLRFSVSARDLIPAFLLNGKKMQTTVLNFIVKTPDIYEYRKLICGLADGTFAKLSDEDMGFDTSKKSAEWTSTIATFKHPDYYLQRYGPRGESISVEDWDNDSELNRWRPVLRCEV